MKKKLRVGGMFHRDAHRVTLRYERDTEIYKRLKSLNLLWSRTANCFYATITPSFLDKLGKRLTSIGQELAVEIDHGELEQYLARLPESWGQLVFVYPNQPDTGMVRQSGQEEAIRKFNRRSTVKTAPISKENLVYLQRMEQQLVLKAYSPSTMRTYLNEVRQFLQLLGKHDAGDFTTDRIRDYLAYCSRELKLSEHTIHSRMNALKFLYEQVLGREKIFYDIPRPQKPLQLPKLLNEEEIRRLFNALGNKKHKAMLFTAFSAGLRVSELAKLKIEHIDGVRKQIFIERSKGKKDRYVGLSKALQDILRMYLKEWQPRPQKYLFESDQTRDAYPIRTIQQIFSNAKHKAGILKSVGIHSLRHSFATQLIEKGTDIYFIKDILGHFNIKTTERYLHVSRKDLMNINSPFDDLWNKGDITW